ADLLEQFWAGVVAFESAPKRPLTQLLAESGLDLPPARQLTGPALRRTLRALIRRLAEWRYYLVHTDHLSDRDLYTLLREDVLPQPDSELPPESVASMIFDLTFFDRGLPPGTTFLRYYADEQMRRDKARELAPAELPPHTDPPFDRDRRLPAAEPGPVILATPGLGRRVTDTRVSSAPGPRRRRNRKDRDPAWPIVYNVYTLRLRPPSTGSIPP
ncbi:MAG: hypothetical protein V3T28_08025, partial [Gemmatimonadales bacterium]